MNQENSKKVAILSCGTYIPSNRLKITDIEVAHNFEAGSMSGLGLTEKAFAGIEEDTLTMAYESSKLAINRINNYNTQDIQAVYVGSETHVYAVKPTSSILAGFLNINNAHFSADLEFACKAGTAAMQVVYNMIKAGSIESGLVSAADVAKGSPSDLLEFTAASGASSFILGDFAKYSEQAIALIVDTVSYTSDTPDFWREESEIYPTHTGRFSGTSYEKTVSKTIHLLLEKTGLNVTDFDHVVLHMPNGKLPLTTGLKLGFSKEQLSIGLMVSSIGNTYSACTLIGLSNVLEHISGKKRVLVCSYGSGAGADAFVIETVETKKETTDNYCVKNQLQNKEYKTYSDYKLNALKRYA